MSARPGDPPAVPALRRLLGQAAAALEAAARRGRAPLAIAPAPATAVPGWDHVHAYPELFIQCAGASRFACPDGELTLTAGGALLFPPLSAHVERVAVRPFANLVLTVRDRAIGMHLSMDSPRTRHQPQIVRPDVIACDPFGDACLSALARAGERAELAAALLIAFCAWTKATLAAAPPPGSSGPDRVRQVRGIVEARLGSPDLSVAQLARWSGCHPDHLARSFRRATGETLIGYIQRRRLELARDLLADPRCRVREASRRAGFADPAYFSRVWRRRFGQPPSRGR